jgi:hypothetical protein
MTGRPATRSAADDETVGALTERLNTEHRLWLRQLRSTYGSRASKPATACPAWQSAPIARSRTCQWPISKDRPWRMCGEPSRLGYSFCLEHARQAFVRMCEDTTDEA